MFEAQAGIAPAHNWFAISRVSASPLGQYPHAIIFPMITDQDITKLKKVFATKDELLSVSDKVDSLEVKVDSLEVKVDALDVKVDALVYEVGDLKVEMGEMNDKMDSMHNKIDRFLGVVDTLRLEEGAGAVTLARHTRQIKSLATHTGATLPD